MASHVPTWFCIFACVLLFNSMSNAQTCTDCFLRSRATYDANSDGTGTTRGSCGFRSFGARMNGGDVAAADSKIYRNGAGCGACYQIRCTNSNDCSDEGVVVVITDSGGSDNADFILNRKAFSKLAKTADAAKHLESFGVVAIEYRRVSCSYPGKNISIRIDESSGNPYYLAFVIYNQQGMKDVTAVQLCETQSFTCQLLDRNYGTVWGTAPPPRGPLLVRMLLSDGGDGSGDQWVVPTINIPQDRALFKQRNNCCDHQKLHIQMPQLDRDFYSLSLKESR